MKITSVRQGVVPIMSAIANAYIDFSKMTCSVVAVITLSVMTSRFSSAELDRS